MGPLASNEASEDMGGPGVYGEEVVLLHPHLWLLDIFPRLCSEFRFRDWIKTRHGKCQKRAWQVSWCKVAEASRVSPTHHWPFSRVVQFHEFPPTSKKQAGFCWPVPWFFICFPVGSPWVRGPHDDTGTIRATCKCER